MSMHATTIIGVKKNDEIVIAGDGQVTLGHAVMKKHARKVRRLANNSIVAGFAGSTADAFTLFERLEARLEKYHNQLLRACVELAKDWRMDKYLRKLEAMLIVADKEKMFVLTGTGDVLEPDEDVVAIGSGGNYAFAAAKALISYDNNLTAQDIAVKALNIAADICIYTNHNIIVEKV